MRLANCNFEHPRKNPSADKEIVKIAGSMETDGRRCGARTPLPEVLHVCDLPAWSEKDWQSTCFGFGKGLHGD